MNKELDSQAEQLWIRSEKIDKFDRKFGIYPFQEGGRLVNDFQKLSEQITPIIPATTEEEVQNNELRRKLSGEALYLDHTLSGHYYTFEDVISLYGIDQLDIDGLKNWLLHNKEDVLTTIDRVFGKTEVNDQRLSIPGDIPSYRRQAIEFATTHISNYHKKLSKRFENLTSVGTFLRDITSMPTTDNRSYFNSLTKTLALSIPSICYLTEDQSLHVDEREIIRLFGHEGMGHGLNKVVTETTNLPNFLKRNFETTRATAESVAQHYETIIFEDIASSPKTQEELGIEHKFKEIYQNEKDTRLINLYNRKLFQYVITVLANKELGDMSTPESRKEAINKRVSLISDVALYPGYAVRIVENNKNEFDSQGNVSFGLAQEMVYSAQPVQRVIEEMKQKGVLYDEKGRGKIDMLLLSGYWTPTGLVENAAITEL